MPCPAPMSFLCIQWPDQPVLGVKGGLPGSPSTCYIWWRNLLVLSHALASHDKADTRTVEGHGDAFALKNKKRFMWQQHSGGNEKQAFGCRGCRFCWRTFVVSNEDLLSVSNAQDVWLRDESFFFSFIFSRSPSGRAAVYFWRICFWISTPRSGLPPGLFSGHGWSCAALSPEFPLRPSVSIAAIVGHWGFVAQNVTTMMKRSSASRSLPLSLMLFICPYNLHRFLPHMRLPQPILHLPSVPLSLSASLSLSLSACLSLSRPVLLSLSVCLSLCLRLSRSVSLWFPPPTHLSSSLSSLLLSCGLGLPFCLPIVRGHSEGRCERLGWIICMVICIAMCYWNI